MIWGRQINNNNSHERGTHGDEKKEVLVLQKDVDMKRIYCWLVIVEGKGRCLSGNIPLLGWSFINEARNLLWNDGGLSRHQSTRKTMNNLTDLFKTKRRGRWKMNLQVWTLICSVLDYVSPSPEGKGGEGRDGIDWRWLTEIGYLDLVRLNVIKRHKKNHYQAPPQNCFKAPRGTSALDQKRAGWLPLQQWAPNQWPSRCCCRTFN